jgi:hypothetical protein
MRRRRLLRLLTALLAIAHTFPAKKHLALFFAAPSLAEAYKGFGALAAVVLYLLPVGLQARGLTFLWHEQRRVVRLLGLALAAIHAVPAFDHVPRLLSSPTWADAWRGVGTTLAVVWFLLPLRRQGAALAALARIANLRHPGLGGESFAVPEHR